MQPQAQGNAFAQAMQQHQNQLAQQYDQQGLQASQQGENGFTGQAFGPSANPGNMPPQEGGLQVAGQQGGPDFQQYANLPNVQKGLSIVGNFLNGIGHPLAGIFSQFHAGVPGQVGSVPGEVTR